MALFNDMLKNRKAEQEKMQRAKENLVEIEDEIKHQLIAEQWTEFLSVDWNKLNRQYGDKS